MEMTAAIEALRQSDPPLSTSLITTDSQYLVKGMTEWIAGWQRKGWRNSKKEPVVNKDLWEQLLVLTKVTFSAMEMGQGACRTCRK